jgi:hypothetical protein
MEWMDRDDLTATQRAMLMALEWKGPSLTRLEVMRHVGASEATYYRSVKSLIATGLVKMTDDRSGLILTVKMKVDGSQNESHSQNDSPDHSQNDCQNESHSQNDCQNDCQNESPSRAHAGAPLVNKTYTQRISYEENNLGNTKNKNLGTTTEQDTGSLCGKAQPPKRVVPKFIYRWYRTITSEAFGQLCTADVIFARPEQGGEWERAFVCSEHLWEVLHENMGQRASMLGYRPPVSKTDWWHARGSESLDWLRDKQDGNSRLAPFEDCDLMKSVRELAEQFLAEYWPRPDGEWPCDLVSVADEISWWSDAWPEKHFKREEFFLGRLRSDKIYFADAKPTDKSIDAKLYFNGAPIPPTWWAGSNRRCEPDSSDGQSRYNFFTTREKSDALCRELRRKLRLDFDVEPLDPATKEIIRKELVRRGDIPAPRDKEAILEKLILGLG